MSCDQRRCPGARENSVKKPGKTLALSRAKPDPIGAERDKTPLQAGITELRRFGLVARANSSGGWSFGRSLAS